VLLYLCGSLGKPVFAAEEEKQERQYAYEVLEAIQELAGGETICLWAPQEIMEYTRAYDGDIYLVYGRNMWDDALMGYSYETYGDMEQSLYQWMESLQNAVGMVMKDFLVGGVSCMEAAAELGVNYILLPGTVSPEQVRELEKATGLQSDMLEDHYIFTVLESERKNDAGEN